MIGWIRSIVDWFEERLSLRTTVWPVMAHPVPRGAKWWYVFGSASMTLLALQMVTGACLALVYVPAADKAYESLVYLNYQQNLGWFLRAMHFWGANGMVVMVVIHMTQVFLFGAFKYPRELTWLVGVVLLALTLAMGFTGQVLRWDQDAFWGLGVGASMAGRVPLLGPAIVQLLLGGQTIGGESLSRFFALHVFVLPGLLIAALTLHLFLVLRLGVSEPPTPGKLAGPESYPKQYHEELAKDGVPFFPDAAMRDAIFCALSVIAVVVLAACFGPFGPKDPPDPTIIKANPRPEWYFLPLFALLALSPPQFETAIMLVLPVAALGVLAAVPLLFGRGERAPSRRPFAVASVVVIFVSVITLGWLGHTAPWSPIMDAWSSMAVPQGMVYRRSPGELQGAAVFQNKNCRNCHALDGVGGERGPDLTTVAARLTSNELIRQVLQGGGDMPAFGKQLSPAEVDCLVRFLVTLHKPGQPLPRDPATQTAMDARPHTR